MNKLTYIILVTVIAVVVLASVNEGKTKDSGNQQKQSHNFQSLGNNARYKEFRRQGPDNLGKEMFNQLSEKLNAVTFEYEKEVMQERLAKFGRWC